MTMSEGRACSRIIPLSPPSKGEILTFKNSELIIQHLKLLLKLFLVILQKRLLPRSAPNKTEHVYEIILIVF